MSESAESSQVAEVCLFEDALPDRALRAACSAPFVRLVMSG